MTSAAFSAPGSKRVRRHASRASVPARRALLCLLVAATSATFAQAPTTAAGGADDRIVKSIARPLGGEPKFVDLYDPPARWPGTIHWRYNPANAPAAFVDTATTVGVIAAAFDQWAGACGVRHAYDGTTATPPAREIDVPGKGLQPDLENVVGWGSPGVSIAGQATVWNDVDASKVVLIDGDIVFSVTLVSDLGGLGATAAHEFGHVIGLDHSNVNDQIMSGPPLSSYSGLARLQVDDIHGCRCLYGLPAGVLAPSVCSLPTSLDFGSVTAGTTSALHAVTVSNSGNAPLIVGQISADD